ncbi:MAG TPA: hypothetical protein VGN61_14330 [Verrucomicrobiae bacterium]|jgi:hypothetical protein
MKREKRILGNSNVVTVKKESEKSPAVTGEASGQFIPKAIAAVKSQIEAIMEPPKDRLGIKFAPFGPIQPPYGVESARFLVQQVYAKALATKYFDSGDLCSFIECAKFHPGLIPEVEAFQALADGMATIQELCDVYPDDKYGSRSLTEVEKRMSFEIRNLEDGDGSMDGVLNILFRSGYEDLLKDNPAAKDTVDIVRGIGEAHTAMFELKKWMAAQ